MNGGVKCAVDDASDHLWCRRDCSTRPKETSLAAAISNCSSSCFSSLPGRRGRILSELTSSPSPSSVDE